MTNPIPLAKGQVVQWGTLACVIILIWDKRAVVSPLASEDQFEINQKEISRIIYDKPA